MKEEKRDRRIKYTKKQLQKSLIELLSDKPLYKISIKEICEKADINRSTFYAHYETQYDLYEEIVQKTATDIKEIIDSFPGNRTSLDTIKIFRDALLYVEKNREFFLVLLSEKGNLTVGENISSIFDSIRDIHIYSNDEEENNRDFDEYISLFILSGTASILWKWLNTENRIPADEFASLIYGISIRGLRGATIVRKSSKSVEKKTENNSATFAD